MKKILFFIGAIFFLCLADQASAFSISPVKVLQTLDPGQSQAITIKVTNDEEQSMTFRPVVLGVKQDSQGRPIFLSGYNQAEKWVKTQPANVFVPKDQSAEFYFTVSVPEGAYPGSYYLALAVRPVKTDGSAALSGQLASLLHLQVAGTAHETLKILKWESSQDVFSQKTWRFGLDLENKGNVVLPLSGEVEIKDWRGRVVLKQNLELGGSILPEALRFSNFNFDLAGQQVYLPGLYQAKVKVIYGLTNQESVSKVSVWFIPWWTRLLLGFLVLGVLLLFVLLIKRKKRVFTNHKPKK